jgi:hypothetical protein
MFRARLCGIYPEAAEESYGLERPSPVLGEDSRTKTGPGAPELIASVPEVGRPLSDHPASLAVSSSSTKRLADKVINAPRFDRVSWPTARLLAHRSQRTSPSSVRPIEIRPRVQDQSLRAAPPWIVRRGWRPNSPSRRRTGLCRSTCLCPLPW